jgi:hypothetical protein
MTPDGSAFFGLCDGRAFGWRKSTGRFDLGQPEGPGEVTPQFVSRDGSLVVGSYRGTPGGIFMWHEGGKFELIASAGGPGIEGRGHVAGVSADNRVLVGTIADDQHVVNIRWSASTGVSLLEKGAASDCELYTSPTAGTEPGGALSTDGQLASGICTFENLDFGSTRAAVLWDSNGKVRKLASVLEGAGLDLGGAQLQTAKLHPNGRLLSGFATTSIGEARTYVARLP